MIDRVMRRREVERTVGLSRSQIYLLIQRGEFPRPVQLGPRAVGWPESAVQQWLEARKPAMPWAEA